MNKKKLGPIYLVAFIDMLGFGTIIPIVRDYTKLLYDLTDKNIWYIDLLKFDNVEPVVLLAGILMATYSFFQFLFSPVLGRMSDRLGRKKILLLSVAGNVFSYFIWAISFNYSIFLISRIISGATGANISVAQSYIADVTSKKDRAKAMGMMGALFGLGFILGPFFGGLLSVYDLSHLSILGFQLNKYSLIGIFTMTLSIINLIWISFFLEESNVPGENKGSTTKTSNPILLFKQFRNKDLGLLFVVFFMFSLAFVQLESTIAWDLLDRFKMDAKSTGYFFAYLGVLMILVQGGIYRSLIKRKGEVYLAQAGLVFTALGLLILPLYSSLAVLLIAMAILALGMGMANPSVTALVSFYAKPEDTGFSMGILQSFGSMARIIAPITATYMYNYWNPIWPFISGGVITLFAFVLSLKLLKKDSKHSL